MGGVLAQILVSVASQEFRCLGLAMLKWLKGGIVFSAKSWS